MKRTFRYRGQFSDWTTITADRCDILPGGVLAFGRDDGFLILTIAPAFWARCEQVEQEQP
ncbi:hypothetical protein BJF84_13470 [Rhodococcus sp. CUA-806]|nr:hypothetical protein BJF84_13470 [Rhodococcus sp. CUA-806]